RGVSRAGPGPRDRLRARHRVARPPARPPADRERGARRADTRPHRTRADQWPGSQELAVLTSVLTALAGPVLWGALSGMEVALAALLVTGGLVLRADGREPAAAIALGLATLARPEAFLLVPLCWLSGPLTRRRTLWWFVPVATCLLPWVVFNVATVGS